MEAGRKRRPETLPEAPWGERNHRIDHDPANDRILHADADTDVSGGTGARLTRPLARSGVTAWVEQNGTQTVGGVYQKQRGGCHTPPVAFALSLFGFFVLDRTTRTAPAERERTGATPPF